jgi:glucose/arabinose dehydrogenase
MSPMKPGRMLLLVVMGVVTAACGTPPDATSPMGATPTPTLTPPVTPTASAAPPTLAPTPSAAPTPPPIATDPPSLALEPLVDGLTAPTNISPAPGGQLVVTERSGRILAIEPEVREVTVVADLSDRVTPGTSGSDERGLLGFALHPDWPDAARAFVHYTDRTGATVLAELVGSQVDGVPRLDPAGERILLRVDQPFGNHNGGQLAFGPDGYLYLGLGDGGSGGDPQGNGQDPGTLLGAILRLDVSEPGVARAPDDAPFADGGGAPEVHLFGLRNPWRFSFDRLTGELWIADVGQNAYEEVNRVDPVADAGGNLGWNVMEASHCFADADCSPEGFIGPVSEYGRDVGCSVTGGYVYRGAAIEELAGWYLFSDYCAGTILGIPSDVAGLTAPRPLLETGARVSAFGEDSAGELYLADLAGGAIYRIVPGD